MLNKEMRLKWSQELFVELGNSVHKNTYDYSKSIFIRAGKLIEIVCPKHDSFWQSPNHHIHKKQGCPKCGGTSKLTHDDFLKNSKEKHENFYDYTKVVYVNNRTKVEIICQKHGVFWQKPNDHFNGIGCFECGRNRTAISLMAEVSDFVDRVKIVHKKLIQFTSFLEIIGMGIQTPKVKIPKK